MSRKKTEDYVPPDVVDDEEAAANAYQDVCEDAINRHRTNAAKIEAGAPGDCDLCGNYFQRVVSRQLQGEAVNACGRCRDDNKLD